MSANGQMATKFGTTNDDKMQAGAEGGNVLVGRAGNDYLYASDKSVSP